MPVMRDTRVERGDPPKGWLARCLRCGTYFHQHGHLADHLDVGCPTDPTRHGP